jgi:hypothetical protein
LQWAAREFAGVAHLAGSKGRAQQKSADNYAFDRTAERFSEQCMVQNRGSPMSHGSLLNVIQRLLRQGYWTVLALTYQEIGV